MQIKHISEKEAIKRLANATGIEITESLMDELSSTGVLPAYMVFRPIDTVKYPGKRFFLVPLAETDVSKLNGFDSEIRTLPFPLLEDSTFRVSEWASLGKSKFPTLQMITYRVFAARADGQLDPIDEQHFVRVYAPQEVRQATKNVQQYMAGKGYTETPHAYCDAFAAFDIEAVDEWRSMSPFSDDPDYLSPTRRHSQKAELPVSQSKRSELVTISALVQIIETQSKQLIGRKYTQAEITEKILELFPLAISDTTVNNLFSDANKARKAIAADARQKHAELDEFVSQNLS